MLAQTADQLATIFRSEVDDLLRSDCVDDDCLWKEVDVYNYMTEAVDAVMRDTGTKQESRDYPYIAGQSRINFGRRVVEIISARLDSGETLTAFNQNQRLQGLYAPQNQLLLDDNTGTPSYLYTDMSMRNAVLVPTPIVDGIVTIDAKVSIGAPMASGAPLPVSEIKDQRLVLTYMKYLAYMKHDAETYDLARSNDYHSQFLEGVVDRELEIRRNRRPAGTIRMEW